jgi:UDP:flavonoid glycosyltransferase YjiC (YdhE family)
MKKKILLISYSRSSYGYIVPLAVLAKKLKSMQYDIHFACHESQRYIPESFGITNIHSIYEKPPFSHKFNMETTIGYYRAIASGFGNPDYLSKTLSDEKRLLDNIHPDSVFFNMRFTIGQLAHDMGIPSVSVHNLSIFKNYPLFLPVLTRLLKKYKYPITHLFGDYILAPYYPVFYDSSCTLLDNCRADKTIFSSVKRLIFTGSTFINRTSDKPKALVRKELFNNKLPFIFVSLGGSKQVMEVLLYVAKHLNINANYLFITGDNFDKNNSVFNRYISRLRSTTDGKVLVETYVNVPQTYMQAANLTCIHGGLSTVVEAVISQTPVIGFPGSQEQRKNLQYVVSGGGGVIFDPTDDRKKLHDIAFGILNDTHWQKSISMLKQKMEEAGTFNLKAFLNLLS